MKNSNANQWRGALCLFAAIFFAASLVFAQTIWAKNDLTVKASFNESKVATPDEAIELVLSRALTKEESIAVLIGSMDVTSFFSSNENRLSYNAGKRFPLPLGQSVVTVFHVNNTSGEWKEIARLNLVVVKEKPAEQANNETAKDVSTETKTETKAEETKETKSEETKTEAKSKETSSDQTQAVQAQPTENKPAEQPATQNSGAAVTSGEGQASTSQVEGTTSQTETSSSTDAATQPSPESPALGFTPSFAFSIKSQPFQKNFPLESRPTERATFTDFTLQGSVRTEIKHRGFTSQTNFDFAGSSVQQEALRFGALGNNAPHVDLSSYLMDIQIGKAKLQLGHTSFGGNRHLINSFSSRGLTLSIPITKRIDVTAGALNGTSIVGLPNFFGLGKIRHQLQGLSVGFEFLPKRPGGMRLEFTAMNGYVQPLSGFNEGRVNDAEQSKGGGLRFITSDASGRFKLEAGFTVSRFFNPQDSLLDQDGNAVPVPPVTRSAHYIETSYQILRDVSLTKTKKVNLNFTFKHELVNPLFRTLGTSVSADKTQQEFAFDGSIGEITIQAGHTRFNDNVKNVPSILKSLTRANRFTIGVPLASLFGDPAKPSPFLPRLSYSFDRTHQFGASIPVNGGFEVDPSTVPDQFGTNQSFTADWQIKNVTFGYRWNHSLTDNRQTGRELSDQSALVNGINVGFNPFSFLSLNVGLNFDSSFSKETGQINRTTALTTGVNWQMFKGATLAVNLSNTIAGDAAKTNRNRNTNFDAQFSYNFGVERSKFKKFGMQAFVRYANTFARSRDFVFDVNNLTRTQIINAGVTFNFF
jgi:hypothetical protein